MFPRSVGVDLVRASDPAFGHRPVRHPQHPDDATGLRQQQSRRCQPTDGSHGGAFGRQATLMTVGTHLDVLTWGDEDFDRALLRGY